jgi:hypothetical protein
MKGLTAFHSTSEVAGRSCPDLKVAQLAVTMEKEYLKKSRHKTGTSPSEKSDPSFENRMFSIVIKKEAV